MMKKIAAIIALSILTINSAVYADALDRDIAVNEAIKKNTPNVIIKAERESDKEKASDPQTETTTEKKKIQVDKPVCASSNYDQYLTGNEYDQPASGEYTGSQILMNHKASGAYNIYFQATKKGSIESIHIRTEYLGPSMDELITVIDKNGTAHTARRGDWYRLFQALDIMEKSVEGNPYNIAPDLYDEYFAYEMGHLNAEKIADAYIHKIYFPAKYTQE